MKIAGLQKNSMVDYPCMLSAVVFTQGCNMNCGFCHNRCLIGTKQQELIEEEDFFVFLEKRKKLLDAVVISGGEPTLQADLPDFIDKVRKMGFLVKLDTNGTNPSLLKDLLDKNLLDYVAMDVKAPFCKYRQICCAPVDTAYIQKSIELLKESRIEYEFRTTYTPELDQQDILDITGTIRGAKRYVLQQYREVDTEKGIYTGRMEKRDLAPIIHSDLKCQVLSLQFRGDFAFV